MEKQPATTATVANTTKELLQILLDSKVMVEFLEQVYTYTQNQTCCKLQGIVTKCYKNVIKSMYYRE